MKRLDRFILKAFVGPFVAILLVVIFILMMQFLWLYIDELVGKGLGLGVVTEFLLWGSCISLPLALPLSTLLSGMMTVGQLTENNELIAIKSAGVSLTRVMAPLAAVTLLISVAALFISNDLVPYAYNQIYYLREDIGKTKNEIKIPAGTFYDGIDGYILRVDRNDDENGMMYGVMVYDHTGKKGNTTVTLADSASMRLSRFKDYLTFTMYNGSNYQETNSTQYRDTVRDLQKINFTRQDLIIRLENYAFHKSEDDGKFSDQVKTMSLEQLGHTQDSLRRLEREAHLTQLSQFMQSDAMAMTSQLDSAVIASGREHFHHDDYLKWKDIDTKINAFKSASSRANQMASELINYSRESFEYTFVLRRADLEVLKKYSGALACLVLFFIGAPLGALIRKGGLGSSAIVSALFFVLYWVVDISGAKLAKDGAVSASFGAFIATYVLVPIGIFLTWKAVNDSSMFGSDSLKSIVRSLWGKLSNFIHPRRIVYMGTPEFAVAPLDALVRGGYKVVGVVTVADKPSGRGLKVNESAVKKYAVEHGIPVLQPVRLKDPEFLEQLAALKADLFVVVAFRMLPQEVWSMPKLGTFNLHAALLPQYRGAAPINWAVINGEAMTGVTTFMIDKDIDTGGIILREEHRIGENDTAGDVHDALMDMGSKLVLQTVQGIVEKSVETRVQRSFIQGSEVLHAAPKLTRELCHIDWDDSTKNVFNLIRGLSPYPTAFTEIYREGEEQTPLQLKVFSARKVDMHAPPGTILSDGRTYLAVATADGALSLLDVQLSGKKRMEIGPFLAGFRDTEAWHTTKGTSAAVIARVNA